MQTGYDLSHLTPDTFEHLVNSLALRVLGAGHTGFGPGPDGGRDGYFEGTAPYPSESERWSGRWYIQSKFHAPHLSKDAEKWLLARIAEELEAFSDPNTKRLWPDNWIVATNVAVSGSPGDGTFDRARQLVADARPELANRFHIWNGQKVVDFLMKDTDVAKRYGHFLTPGHVLAALVDSLQEDRAQLEQILHALIVTALDEHKRTKLDHAGSQEDSRPGIHQLFIDVPFHASDYRLQGLAMAYLTRVAAGSHRMEPSVSSRDWARWRQHPARARVWFLRGGPGQGKSTITQYFCQVQRAALLLQGDGALRAGPKQRELAREIEQAAKDVGFWPATPRVPLSIELKDYAQWFGKQSETEPKRVLNYLAQRLSRSIGQTVAAGSLRRALGHQSWVAVFDGLDEVPHDTRDEIAREVCYFVDDVAIQANCDLLTLCTSRPQGYAGQFAELDGPTVDLVPLSPEQALACAKPVLRLDRSDQEAQEAVTVLERALETSAVRELMTTPLQAHIMAVIVRDGGQPPERRWELFHRFYEVIYRREANRNLADQRLARILREEQQLLRAVHNHLGFVLHARAETSEGATTQLPIDEFHSLVDQVVAKMRDEEDPDIVRTVVETAKERLVLINTPIDGSHVRFDVRQLQEFFAAEFLYNEFTETAHSLEELRERLEVLGDDVHWREVMHFLLSGLVFNGRNAEVGVAIEVLRQLDDGAEGPERVLTRRFGIGAKLIVYLLEDGMLEQDRRLRERFGICLDALVSSHKEDFTWLGDLRPNSKRWLIEYMYCRFREVDFSESIGAVKLLMIGLENEGHRTKAFLERLLSAPTGYLASLLRGLYTRREGRWVPGELWTRVVIEYLSREDVLEQNIGTSTAFWILQHTSFTKEDDALDLRFFGQLGRNEDINLIEMGANEVNGWATIHYFQHSLPSQNNGYANLAKQLPEEGRWKGFLNLAVTALRFTTSGTLSRYRELLVALVQGTWSHLHFLSPELVASIPVPKDRVHPRLLLAELEGSSSEQFVTMLDEGRIGSHELERQSFSFSYGAEGTEAEFLAILKNWPWVAMDIWAGSLSASTFFRVYSEQQQQILHGQAVLHAVAELSVQYPGYLYDHPAIWGRAFSLMGAAAVEVRRRLCEVTAISISGSFFGPGSDFYPFTLNLPDEQVLLVPLASKLVAMYFPSFEEEFTNKKRLVPSETCQRCATALAELSSLEAIADDASAPAEVRGAAIIVGMLHEEGGLDFALGRKQLLIETCSASCNTLLAAAVATAIGLLHMEAEPEARRLLGELLDAGRNNFVQYRWLNRLMSKWSEASQAPVSRAQVQERWLLGHTRS